MAVATAKASLGEVQEVLDEALDLVEHCGTAYSASDGQTCRQCNQAFFIKLLVCDDAIVDDERAAPSTDLLDLSLPSRLVREKPLRPSTVRTALVLKRAFSRGGRI